MVDFNLAQIHGLRNIFRNNFLFMHAFLITLKQYGEIFWNMVYVI